MGNEMFQARLDDSFAAEVHEYREANHMSKSEVVRHGLRELVQADEADEGAGATSDEEEQERERIRNLAQVGERLWKVGTVAALFATLVPIATVATTAYFSIGVGEFGTLLVAGTTMLFSTIALASLSAGATLVAEALIRYGVHVGPFGRRLDSYITPVREVAA